MSMQILASKVVKATVQTMSLAECTHHGQALVLLGPFRVSSRLVPAPGICCRREKMLADADVASAAAATATGYIPNEAGRRGRSIVCGHLC